MNIVTDRDFVIGGKYDAHFVDVTPSAPPPAYEASISIENCPLYDETSASSVSNPIRKLSSEIASSRSISIPSSSPGSCAFEVGMKLEAIDRKHPALVCVATIAAIDLQRNDSLLIHFDGWSPHYDYWARPDSIDLRPINWCYRRNLVLNLPKGFVGNFTWSSYLSQTKAVAAPAQIFAGILNESAGTTCFQ